MELIVDCASAIMESQRASLFIYDHETEELFTQIQKAQNQIIRIPYNQGIVGSVFCTKQIVNLINAQNDSRFKKEIDMIDQDQVDTILCAPILDLTNRQILGKHALPQAAAFQDPRSARCACTPYPKGKRTVSANASAPPSIAHNCANDVCDSALLC